jgi:hypothetical protein
MGRVNQAMRRARQAGLVTEFQPIDISAYDASMLAAEPFPAEAVQEPAAPEAPKTDAVSRHDDREIQEIFFNTYPEKVWNGPNEAQARLLRLLAKVERHPR